MNVLGDELEIVINRKKIKNIYFKINENLEIEVSAPKLVSDAYIKKLLIRNIASLEKMYKKQKHQREKNESVYFLGKKFDFIYYKKVMMDESNLYGPNAESINNFLEKNSLPYFQKRLDLYKDSFDNLPKFRLRVRKMKSRWGVCNISSMTVTLNTLLIHKDVSLIDYVIVHELSHFEHMNHSKKFWKCVENHYPNYKKARKELKD